MLCFRLKIFFELLNPIFNELIDIITDVFYFNKVTGDEYEQHLHTSDAVFRILFAFAILGMFKFFFVLYITGRAIKDRSMEDVKENLLLLRFSEIKNTYIFWD